MYLTKESVDRFNKLFVLSHDDIKQLTAKTNTIGKLIFMYDIKSHLIMLPTVLSQIIEEYCGQIILNYVLRYPYISEIKVRQIILSIESSTFKFIHDIECGSYDLTCTYIDTSIKIRCPNIHTKRSGGLDMNHDTHFLSVSHNDNIRSSHSLQDSEFNFGLFFDHITKTRHIFRKRWRNNNIFVNKKTKSKSKSIIRDESKKVICITHPNGDIIRVNIINKHNLYACIHIHELIFNLLRCAQQHFALKIK